MGCGKSTPASEPSAGAAEAAKVITEGSTCEDDKRREDTMGTVNRKAFAASPTNVNQLRSGQTASGRNYGGVYVGLPTDAATVASSQRRVGQMSRK